MTALGEGEAGLPLRGLRVLDLTTFLSGPYCTQILGDLGADVIKVESPAGDSSRSIPPHFVGSDSAYFLASNRNKRSIALDLKKPGGLALVKELISRVDVVVENFRPGVCQRLGLDISEIRREQPRLIWASMSGFGQSGPDSRKPAYDMVVQALAGVMSLTGEPDQPAVRLGIPAGDLVAGMFGVIGVLAAIPHQKESGVGRTIDVSMLDGQLAMLSYQATYAMVSGTAPQPQGSRHDSIPTYRSYVGADGGQFVVTANTEQMWRSLCDVVDLPELREDPRFSDPTTRLLNRAELDSILESAFLAKPSETWVSNLVDAGVPTAPIKNVLEALNHARCSGRDMVLDLKSDDGDTIPVVGSPVRYVEGPPSPTKYPPKLGEHADEVLRDVLGLDEDRIHRLRETGVVRH